MSVLLAIQKFAIDPKMQILTAVFLSVSFGAFLLWKQTRQTRYLFAHIGAMLVPVLLLLNSLNCEMKFVDGILGLCVMVLSKILLYAIPISFISAFLLGYYLVPYYYRLRYSAKEITKKIKINLRNNQMNSVRAFLLDSAKPFAFSSRNNIFVSVGLFENLSKKEIEAVVLHELGHIRNYGNLNKLALLFAKISPVARFSSDSDGLLAFEERRADEYAISAHGTARFLNSAKKKVDEFEMQAN